MILLGKPVAEALRKEYEANAPKSKGGRVLTVICDETTDRGYLASIRREADLWGVKVETVKTPLEAAKAGAKKVIDLRENPPFLCGFPVAVDGQAYSDCTQVYHETGVTNTTPCTAEAILRILAFYDIPLEGRNAVIIGRSPRVGKPPCSDDAGQKQHGHGVPQPNAQDGAECGNRQGEHYCLRLRAEGPD